MTPKSVLSYIASMDDEGGEEKTEVFPLPAISSRELKQIVSFLEYHATDPMAEITKPIQRDLTQCNVCAFDVEMVSKSSVQDILVLLTAANYMDIPPLCHLLHAKLASDLLGKTPDEMITYFGVDPSLVTSELKQQSDERLARIEARQKT